MTFTAGLVSLLALVVAQIPTPSMPSWPDLSTHKVIKAEVEINASAGMVWRVLTDFTDYAIWNPYIYPASGQAIAGHTLDLTLRGGTEIRFTPLVLAAKPGQELSWSGRLPANAITRVATFEIHPLALHRVRLTAEETFRGLLLPLASGVTADSATGLAQMTKALRDRAELLDYSPAPVHK